MKRYTEYHAGVAVIKDKTKMKEAMQRFAELEERDSNKGWIPCSERLPEKPRVQYDSYIVQEETVITPYTAYWDGEIWTDTDGDAIKGVVAWMPLPEPYKLEEGSDSSA